MQFSGHARARFIGLDAHSASVSFRQLPNIAEEILCLQIHASASTHLQGKGFDDMNESIEGKQYIFKFDIVPLIFSLTFYKFK